MNHSHRAHQLSAAGMILGVSLITACAGEPPASAGDSEASDHSESIDEDFDMEELIEAAQDEGPITIYDNTSKVEEMAEAFSEEYGIEATGVKLDASEALEMVTREAQSGNVVGDVVAIPDIPAMNNQLLPHDFVYTYVPEPVEEDIEEGMRDPLVLVTDPSFWTYNDEVHETCPITNMWELTEPEWSGKVAFEDPVGHNGTLDWYSQMSQFGEDELRAAYEAHFDEELDSEHETAAEEWVSRMASNSPILTGSSEDASEAVGAPGQENPPMALISSAKYRNIEDQGYHHAVCEGLDPWAGRAVPKAISIASETENPNAARLYIHYVLSQEGISPQIEDGKISSNQSIEQPEDPSDVGQHIEELFFFDNTGLDEDWENREDWQDLWRTSSN